MIVKIEDRQPQIKVVKVGSPIYNGVLTGLQYEFDEYGNLQVHACIYSQKFGREIVLINSIQENEIYTTKKGT